MIPATTKDLYQFADLAGALRDHAAEAGDDLKAHFWWSVQAELHRMADLQAADIVFGPVAPERIN